MDITFDPIEKIIQLDTFNVSEGEIWSAYVDWTLEGDNIKYGEGMTQIGGYDPIALYIYLNLGWKIRPKESDGVTTISGNILTEDGSSPISPTLGQWNVLVKMETPIKAVAISVETGVSGLTESESEQLSIISTKVNTITSVDIDALNEKLKTLNDGIKKASLLIPHSTDL